MHALLTGGQGGLLDITLYRHINYKKQFVKMQSMVLKNKTQLIG